METRRLFGVKYAVGSIDNAVAEVLLRLGELKGRYVCFSNVHTLITAVENEKYRKVLNGSAYTFPDGAPIARRLKRGGEKDCERIAGPDFMEAVFNASAEGQLSHFFYGSSWDVLEKLETVLKKRYPNINIAGKYSPPYRKLSPEEDKKIISLMNRAGADIIWIGLGAPRQEIFMYKHQGKVDGLMAGVGAGFDFQAEAVKRAPLWMQKLSLEWLFRLLTDPKRLAKRYLITNTKFLWYCLKNKS